MREVFTTFTQVQKPMVQSELYKLIKDTVIRFSTKNLFEDVYKNQDSYYLNKLKKWLIIPEKNKHDWMK
jgi:hypothetical protein